MVRLTIIPNGEGNSPELAGKKIHQPETLKIAALPGGMQSGAPSVAFIVPLEDGSYVFAETSLKLFLTAADTLKATYGDPRRSEPEVVASWEISQKGIKFVSRVRMIATTKGIALDSITDAQAAEIMHECDPDMNLPPTNVAKTLQFLIAQAEAAEMRVS